MRPSHPASHRPAEELALPAPGFASAAGMIRSSTMLSQSILADPRSAKARRGLRSLSSDERKLQLCNIEAMGQIHAWRSSYQPQSIVAYAFGAVQQSPASIRAPGAAVFSKGEWRRLSYECEFESELVTKFAFQLGELVPRTDWQDRGLPDQILDDGDL